MPTASITAPPDAAPEIATPLVAEELAACVNRLPCESVYRWEGEIHDEPEVILLAKTTAERFGPLRERVLALHPHDVPCVERFEEDAVLGTFATWRAEATGTDTGGN